MKKVALFVIGVVFASSAFPDQRDSLKCADVVSFVRNAENCEHLAGEWDPDMSKQEKRTVERNIDRYCGSAQKQRQSLLKKYKKDGAVLDKLNQYESVISYAGKKPTS